MKVKFKKYKISAFFIKKNNTSETKKSSFLTKYVNEFTKYWIEMDKIFIYYLTSVVMLYIKWWYCTMTHSYWNISAPVFTVPLNPSNEIFFRRIAVRNSRKDWKRNETNINFYCQIHFQNLKKFLLVKCI